MVTEETLQSIVDQRGYLIIATIIRRRVGQVIDEPIIVDNHGRLMHLKVVVAQETDRADFAEQHKFLGEVFVPATCLPFYYRVTAE